MHFLEGPSIWYIKTFLVLMYHIDNFLVSVWFVYFCLCPVCIDISLLLSYLRYFMIFFLLQCCSLHYSVSALSEELLSSLITLESTSLVYNITVDSRGGETNKGFVHFLTSLLLQTSWAPLSLCIPCIHYKFSRWHYWPFVDINLNLRVDSFGTSCPPPLSWGLTFSDMGGGVLDSKDPLLILCFFGTFDVP